MVFGGEGLRRCFEEEQYLYLSFLHPCVLQCASVGRSYERTLIRERWPNNSWNFATRAKLRAWTNTAATIGVIKAATVSSYVSAEEGTSEQDYLYEEVISYGGSSASSLSSLSLQLIAIPSVLVHP